MKKEIKEFLVSNIDKTQLVELKFSKEEAEARLNWEHSKEFKYNGEMYDVIDKIITSDSVFYWCWWDHEETKLNKQLNMLVQQAGENNPQNKERAQRLSNLFNSFYTKLYLHNYLFSNTKKISFQQSNYQFYTSLFIIPDTPPPKV